MFVGRGRQIDPDVTQRKIETLISSGQETRKVGSYLALELLPSGKYAYYWKAIEGSKNEALIFGFNSSTYS